MYGGFMYVSSNHQRTFIPFSSSSSFSFFLISPPPSISTHILSFLQDLRNLILVNLCCLTHSGRPCLLQLLPTSVTVLAHSLLLHQSTPTYLPNNAQVLLLPDLCTHCSLSGVVSLFASLAPWHRALVFVLQFSPQNLCPLQSLPGPRPCCSKHPLSIPCSHLLELLLYLNNYLFNICLASICHKNRSSF